MNELSDNDLVRKYRAGDKKAFEAIVERYFAHVFNFIAKYTSDRVAAEDITQDTFVKVWKNIKKFDETKNFKSWLFTIARNTSLDFLRKKKAIPFSSFEDDETGNFDIEDTEPLAHELLDDEFMRQKVVTIAEQLPAAAQNVLFLRYNQDLTFQEISEVLGESLNTVKSRYRRALIELKKLL